MALRLSSMQLYACPLEANPLAGLANNVTVHVLFVMLPGNGARQLFYFY